MSYHSLSRFRCAWRALLSTVIASVCLAGPAGAAPGDHDGPYSQGDDTAHAIDPAIYYTNASIQAWATGVDEYYRSDGDTGFSDSTQAIGAAGTSVYDVVSLGDLDSTAIAAGDPVGYITLTFDVVIANGSGPDLAVYENGFGNDYAELAFVEVSSNGTDFARFGDTYFGAATAPVGGYAYIDATYIYNLAGKHKVGYGTPFDLEQLVSHPMVTGGQVDLDNINYVRLVDIPGSGDWTDDSGNAIYDSWVTWGSGGADIDGVAVLNVYTDTTAPTVDIIDVTPDPRSTAVSSASIVFSEAVQLFDLPDLVLTRNGVTVTLAGNATLSTSDDITWALDLSALTGTAGEYVLTVNTSDITDLAGNPLDAPAYDLWVVDLDIPTVDIIDVTPDPRNTAVSSVSIVFSEAVQLFDLADLVFMRDGVAVPLTGSATLSTSDDITWALDLSALTSTTAEYLLTVNPSDITDLAGNPLAASASDVWVVDVDAPTVDIADVTPDPRSTAVSSVSIVFSEAIQLFDLSDLVLTRDGIAVTLTGNAALSTSDDVTWALDLSALTNATGEYLLTLNTSDITDLAGNALDAGASDTWVKTPAVTAENGYTVEEYFCAPSPATDPLVSFDWDAAGALYYSTGDPAYGLKFCVFKYDGATTTPVLPQTAVWAGARVTRIGAFIYFNEAGDYSRFDDFYYYRYDPISGIAPVNLGNGSTLNAWGLNTRTGADLFAAAGGSAWSTSIYYTPLDAGGGFVSDPWVNLGHIGDASGPLAFDEEGNMYYANGSATTPQIFRFSAAEVDAAIADPAGSPLVAAGHEWALIDGTASGATGMACDAAGNVVLSATSWTAPSELRLYHTACDGANDGYTVLASYSGRLETVRYVEAAFYVSAPEGIFAILMPPLVVSAKVDGTPEPNVETVDFTVTFTEPVTGLNPDLSDFELVTAASGSSTTLPSLVAGSLTTADNITWQVTVDTGEFEGAVGLNVLDTGAIIDGDGMPLDGAYAGCRLFTVDTAGPEAPVMDAEPLYTNGYGNTVSWSTVSGADAYHVACYSDAGLTAVVDEGETAETFYAFDSLADNTAYWYRAYAVDAFDNAGAWSEAVSSTQNGEPLTVQGVNAGTVNATADQEVELSVTIAGQTGTVTYQWYREESGKAMEAVGDDAPAYSFVAELEDDGVSFYCQVSDDADVATSENFDLSVSAGMPAASGAGIALAMLLVALIAARRWFRYNRMVS